MSALDAARDDIYGKLERRHRVCQQCAPHHNIDKSEFPHFQGKQNKKQLRQERTGIKDYVVLQKPQEQADRLPHPRTLILDFTMTHPRIGRSHVRPSGQLTNIRISDGVPELDGDLKVVDRKKIIHYRQLYLDRPEPIAFMPVAVDTSGRIYDDFLRLLFLHAHCLFR